MVAQWLSPLAVSYQVTQEWNVPNYWDNGASGIHGGIDLAPAFGTHPPVYAARSGTVAEVVPNHAVGGNYVVIQHADNYWTYYGHLATINVSVGQGVTPQTLVGICGNTGAATGIHLHFEVWHGGKWQRINPRDVINFNGQGRNTNGDTSSSGSRDVNNQGRVTTMQCLYERPRNAKGEPDNNSNEWGIFFCNGVNVRHVSHPDTVHIIKEIYRLNNGHEIPTYNKKQWSKNAPWYERLESVMPFVK